MSKLTFKNWLQPLLQDRQLNVSQFCREIGISREILYKYYREQRCPSDRTLCKMKDLFQVYTGAFPYTREKGGQFKNK